METQIVKVLEHTKTATDLYWREVKKEHKKLGLELQFDKCQLLSSMVHAFYTHMTNRDIVIHIDNLVVPPMPPAIPLKEKDNLEMTEDIEIDQIIVKDTEEQILPQVEKILNAEEFIIPDTGLMIGHALSYMIHYYTENKKIHLSKEPSLPEQPKESDK